MKVITIDIELDEQAAVALSQFLKRINWEERRRNAIDDYEADRIGDGLSSVQDALARHGFNPR